MSYIDLAIPELDQRDLKVLMQTLVTAFALEQPYDLQQNLQGARRSFRLFCADANWIVRFDPATDLMGAVLAFEREACHLLENEPCFWPQVRTAANGGWFAEVTIGEQLYLATCQRFEIDCRPAGETDDIQRFGKHLATMHDAVDRHGALVAPASRQIDSNYLLFSPLERIIEYVGRDESIDTARGFLAREIEPRMTCDNVGICHSDAHQCNALLRSDNSCFLIDTEYLGYGPRCYDIGTAAWNFGLHGNYEGLRAFLSGYRACGPASQEMLDGLWVWIAARHVWWLGLRSALTAAAVPVPGGTSYIREELKAIWRFEAFWASLKQYR